VRGNQAGPGRSAVIAFSGHYQVPRSVGFGAHWCRHAGESYVSLSQPPRLQVRKRDHQVGGGEFLRLLESASWWDYACLGQPGGFQVCLWRSPNSEDFRELMVAGQLPETACNYGGM